LSLSAHGLTLTSGAPSARCEKGKTVNTRARIIATVSLVAAGAIAGTAGMTAAGHNDQTVLRGDVMIGVQAPYTGAANAIRGINGGGAPWSIDDSEFRLRSNGRLEVEVEGLVVTASGVNPAATFKVTVSCLSKDAAGLAITANVSTDPFPANTAGDAEVETTIDLPSPCVAPIIFVANGVSGSWFASTGA
jgi:hypothetical protein